MKINSNRPNQIVILIVLPLMIFSILAPLSGQPDAVAQTLRTRTPRPTRTPTPTRTPVLAALKRQLFFIAIGGGSDDECDPLVPGSRRNLPMIVDLGRLEVHGLTPDKLQNRGGLCIFGLPFKGGLELELYNPSGKLVDRVTYRLGAYNKPADFWWLEPVRARSGTRKQEAYFEKDVEVIYINMWWPEGLSVGRWTAIVKTPYGTVKGQFDVPRLPGKLLVNFGRPPRWVFSNASPLEEPRESYLTSSSCVSRKSGDVLNLYGANFKPGSQTPIGLYQLDPSYAGPNDGAVNLFVKGSARADRKGEWRYSYRIRSTDPPGRYYLITVTRPKEDEMLFVGPKVCYEIERWQPCRNTYPSRLRAGISAKVNEKPPLANRVRREPNRSAAVVGRLQPGEKFKILDGPSCSNAWVWWYVESKDGLRGWTAEGERNTYWLSPLQ